MKDWLKARSNHFYVIPSFIFLSVGVFYPPASSVVAITAVLGVGYFLIYQAVDFVRTI